MSYSKNMAVMLATFSLVAATAAGCGDSSNNTTGGGASTTTSNGGNGGEGGTGGSGGVGGTGGTGGSGGSTTSSTDTTPVDNGVQATDFVSAGGTAKSANFRMVFTLGQSTQNQGKTTSANFSMQGGLIGATGGK